MEYLERRSIYYTVLMQEIVEGGSDSWNFIGKLFGLSDEERAKYVKPLSDRTLAELSSEEDIRMYENYLGAFCRDRSEFGNSPADKTVIEAKALALHKVRELFGENTVKGNRLRSLSHNYERDHAGAVLYALRLLYLGGECERLAKDVLLKELSEGKNSDAGLVLLSLADGEQLNDVARQLAATPDMVLRPDLLQALGISAGAPSPAQRPIGF